MQSIRNDGVDDLIGAIEGRKGTNRQDLFLLLLLFRRTNNGQENAQWHNTKPDASIVFLSLIIGCSFCSCAKRARFCMMYLPCSPTPFYIMPKIIYLHTQSIPFHSVPVFLMIKTNTYFEYSLRDEVVFDDASVPVRNICTFGRPLPSRTCFLRPAIRPWSKESRLRQSNRLVDRVS